MMGTGSNTGCDAQQICMILTLTRESCITVIRINTNRLKMPTLYVYMKENLKKKLRTVSNVREVFGRIQDFDPP